MKRTFCVCKPSKKADIEPYQNLTGSYKKHGGSELTPRYTEYQKV